MTATVLVDGRTYTGTIYYTRENGWKSVECPDGHVASGPVVSKPTSTH